MFRPGYLWAVGVKAPLIILATIAMGTVSVAVSFADSGGRRQHAIARAWARLLVRIAGIRVRLHGIENIEPQANYVFAGNHLSLFDTPVVLANIPQQFLFLVSAKYVKLPFLGTHLRRSGHFSVPMGDTRASLKVMSEAARRIGERRLSVLLFPEGSRARGPMQEFKEGAAYIAIKAGVPVVPFALRGTREVLPVGSHYVRGLPVDFILGRPIATAGMTLRDRAELTGRIRSAVVELLETLERRGS